MARIGTRVDKTLLSERDICAKFITSAVKQAGWDVMSQFREEVCFTKGRIPALKARMNADLYLGDEVMKVSTVE